MIRCYCRVSTAGQTVKNQRIEIQKWLKANRPGQPFDFTVETASGAKDVGKRLLGGLVEELKEGDELVCTELSRLGRSLVMIFDLVEALSKKKVRLVAIKNQFELGNDIYSKVVVFAFGLSAEIERSLISERTKMGLARARKEGKRLGWEKGRPRPPKLSGKEGYVRRELRKGRSKLSLANELGVTWPTMARFVKENGLG